jgi:hypothetical protein
MGDVLDDDDRRLIAQYRAVGRSGTERMTWVYLVLMSILVAAGVIVTLVMGSVGEAITLAVLWSLFAYIGVWSTKRRLRLAKLVDKLATMAEARAGGA